MSGTEIAALIAAIAFVILVLVISYVLLSLLPKLKVTLDRANVTLNQVQTTVEETNQTIKVVTKDVDILAHQVEDLLVKGNTLLNDVNVKVATIQPLFQAAADLGESVSTLNQTSRNAASKIGVISTNAAKASVATKLGKSAFSFLKRNKK